MKFLKIALKVLSLLILLIGVVAGAIFVVTRKPELVGLAKGSRTIERESDVMVKEVGKLIVLPADEKPTVALVSDIEKIKNQSFFKNAQNGDSILIYPTANKAILYRPSARLIIEVGAVNTVQTADSPTPVLTQAKFSVLNGTQTAGLTKTIEEELKKVMPSAEIIKANAAKQDYTKTILIDLNGNKTTEAENLAKKLNISVGTLPEGEVKPEDIDFLIIVGNDKAA